MALTPFSPSHSELTEGWGYSNLRREAMVVILGKEGAIRNRAVLQGTWVKDLIHSYLQHNEHAGQEDQSSHPWWHLKIFTSSFWDCANSIGPSKSTGSFQNMLSNTIAVVSSDLRGSPSLL